MTDKKHRTASPTDRRPDCVTETRMGNTVLIVSGFFKKDTTATAADKMMKVLEAETALYCMSRGYEKSGHAGEHDRWNGSDYNAAISSAI